MKFLLCIYEYFEWFVNNFVSETLKIKIKIQT